jgi:hypothetical protein
MDNSRIRKEIRNILNDYFNQISEGGGSFNNKFVYAFGANQFPYYGKPKTPQELDIETNKKFDLNDDSYEELRNGDSTVAFPMLPA